MISNRRNIANTCQLILNIEFTIKNFDALKVGPVQLSMRLLLSMNTKTRQTNTMKHLIRHQNHGK